MKRVAFIAPVLAALAVVAAGGAATLAAPTATTGPVSTVTNTSATVSGGVNPGGETTTWYVEYGTTTSYGKQTSSNNAGSGTSTVSISATIGSLSSATTYHYRVVAKNPSGTSHGSDGILTTTAPTAAPTVSTDAADQIGPFKAALHGSVDPNGLSTTWFFEYGKTTGYGTKTPSANAGSGTSSQGVSVLVQSLEAGVTYHFRLVATSSAGTSRGSDGTFTTDAPPSVKTGVTQSVTAVSAVVTGTINPRGRASNVWFEYGTSTAYGSKTATQSAGFGTSDMTVSATISGLGIGKTYHYRIVGQSDAGTVHGADASFRTSSAPTVVTGAASLIDATSGVMNGTVNPNGRSTSWWFEFGTSTNYGGRTDSHAIGNGTVEVGAADTARRLTPNTTYHYRLVASSSGGTSRGADATFTTLGPPTAHTGAVTRVSTSTATVSGKVNTLSLAGTYWIEYGRTTSYGFRTSSGSLQATSSDVQISVPLTGLVPGRRYHFRVVVSTSAGSTASNDASFGTAPLPRSPSGRIVRCTITGTTGPDVLRGTPGPDVICGLGGDDVIYGLEGNDVIYGRPGNDNVNAGRGNQGVHGGIGLHRLQGWPGQRHARRARRRSGHCQRRSGSRSGACRPAPRHPGVDRARVLVRPTTLHLKPVTDSQTLGPLPNCERRNSAAASETISSLSCPKPR